jgi:hypothetical protein
VTLSCQSGRFPNFLKESSWLIASMAIYFILAGGTLLRQGDGWDEQTDSWIATSLREDWLCGKSIDPTQTRLQMYLGALFSPSTAYDDSPIPPGRTLALFYGAIGLCGAWAYGRALGGRTAGNVAAILLALSPYYLSYARLGYTEGDMLLCAILPFLALFVMRLTRRGRLGDAAVTGLLLGLGAATKFTFVLLLPPVLIAVFLSRAETTEHEKGPSLSGRGRFLPWLFALLFLLLLTFGYRLPSVGWQGSPRESLDAMAKAYAGLPRDWKLTHYLLTAFLAAGFFLYAALHRGKTLFRWQTAGILCLATPLVFLAVCPAHTANPDTLASFLNRASGAGPGLAGYFERAAVMLLSIVLKVSPLAGMAMLAAPIARLCRLGARESGFFVIVSFTIYFAAMLTVGFAQVFYLLAFLTILAPVLGAELVFWLGRVRRATLIAVSVAALWLVVDLFRCAPDYNLSAYPYLGARYLFGHSTLGYTSVVTVPNDGSSQVLEWLKAYGKSGEKALVFVPGTTDWAHAHQPGRPYALTLVNGTDVKTPHDLAGYDYVATQIYFDTEESLGPEWPRSDAPIFTYEWYDRRTLEADFEKIFAVRRAFGIEVAAVWKRKGPSETAAK